MKRREVDMLQGPILPAIIRYTIPVIITSVLQMLFTAADLMVVGWFCGSRSVAAVGATTSITYLFINLFIGLSGGVGVTVAHSIGSRNDTAIQNTVHTAMLTAFAGGIFLTVLGWFASQPMLKFMGTPEEILPFSALYMKIYFLGMIFNMVYNFSASILRASGDTQSPLYYLLFSGVFNVVLNLLFVVGFGMDVAGVALATIISESISAILCVRKLMMRRDACQLKLNMLRIDYVQFMKILRIGVPAGLQASLFSISNVTIQSAINSFGEVFVAGNSAATSIEGFMYVTVNSFQQTAVNFVGQNYGAGQYDRARKITRACFTSVIVTGIAVSWTVLAICDTLLGFYIDDSMEAIAYGMIRFAVCNPIYFMIGLQDVITGVLRGYGHSVAPMIISVLGICGLRVTWINTIFRLPQFHTPHYLYLIFPISWTITFVFQMIYYCKMIRKKQCTK